MTTRLKGFVVTLKEDERNSLRAQVEALANFARKALDTTEEIKITLYSYDMNENEQKAWALADRLREEAIKVHDTFVPPPDPREEAKEKL